LASDLFIAGLPVLPEPAPSEPPVEESEPPDFPAIPLVEPSLRLLSDLVWSPGFSTGTESTASATLVLEGRAHLRPSAIIASSGKLVFAAAAGPFRRLEG